MNTDLKPPSKNWDESGPGILVRTDRGAIVQLDDSHSQLVSRESAPNPSR